MRHRLLALAALLLVGLSPVLGDSGEPIGVEWYSSASGEYRVEVDPRWDEEYSQTNALLTLVRRDELVWQKAADDFEGFDFPMHALVADDGRHLVFGGYSVHNFGNYDEGLRFYDSEGRLIRFISRRDLPPGPHSISTAAWFDAERTMIEGHTLLFFTPGRDQSIDFDIRTGETLQEGAVVPNQGDDEKNWQKGWLEQR